MLACTFQSVLEEKAKPVRKSLEEDLSLEDNGEKIVEEIKDENKTEPGSLKISVALIYIAHDQAHDQVCFTPVLRLSIWYTAQNVKTRVYKVDMSILFYTSSYFSFINWNLVLGYNLLEKCVFK